MKEGEGDDDEITFTSYNNKNKIDYGTMVPLTIRCFSVVGKSRAELEDGMTNRSNSLLWLSAFYILDISELSLRRVDAAVYHPPT